MPLESSYTGTLVIHHPSGDITLNVETWEDGGLSVSGAKHRDPVTRKETARGGLRSRENLKLSREADAATMALYPRIEDAIGRDRVTAVRQLLGSRDEAVGEPQTITGILGPVTPPSSDLQGDGVSMIEFEVETDE